MLIKLRSIFVSVIRTAFLLVSGIAWAQYGVDRQIQFANEAREKSKVRVEATKAEVDDTVRNVKDLVAKLTDPIFDAQFNCEKRVYRFDRSDQVDDMLRFLSNAVSESERNIVRIKESINAKIDIASRSRDRVCYKGTESNLEPYLNCLTARERLAHLLSLGVGVSGLEVMYKVYVSDRVKNYTACSRKEGAIREQDFLEVGKAASGIGGMLKLQGDKLNKSAADFLSISF